jgi:hypothetical protein
MVGQRHGHFCRLVFINGFQGVADRFVKIGPFRIGQREESGILGFIGYVVNEFGLALVVGLIYAQVFVLSTLDAALVGEIMSGTTGGSLLTLSV